MADKALSEMIAAFAAGCMDKENYMQFKDYIDEGGNLPKGELGELQNIISMIPVILDLEKPDPSIKDLVAKKLIGMKEEIKTKILEGKKKTTATATKLSRSSISSPKNKTISFIDKKASTTTSAFQFGDEEPQNPLQAKQNKIKEPIQEQKSPAMESKKIESPEKITGPQSIIAPPQLINQSTGEHPKPTTQEKNSSGLMGLIALLLSMVLLSILAYFTFTSIKSLTGTVDDLTTQVNALKSQISTANNFISNYTSLIEFFNYKDILVTGLSSSDTAEKGSAQILLSFGQKEGLIQFKDVKPLQPNQGYQIWVQSKGQSYSLGVYQPSGSEYLKISSFPFLPKENIELYFVTIESKDGSPTPSNIIYLSSAADSRIPQGKIK